MGSSFQTPFIKKYSVNLSPCTVMLRTFNDVITVDDVQILTREVVGKIKVSESVFHTHQAIKIKILEKSFSLSCNDLFCVN
jgi:hypothetical protein